MSGLVRTASPRDPSNSDGWKVNEMSDSDWICSECGSLTGHMRLETDSGYVCTRCYDKKLTEKVKEYRRTQRRKKVS